MVTNNSPDEKPLKTASFAVHASRGLIRDARTRRKAMVLILTTALLLMVLGSTLLQTTLNPREHPGWFIFFWILCAWFTVTAILLAAFDLLMLRSEARKAQRALREQTKTDSSGATTNQ